MKIFPYRAILSGIGIATVLIFTMSSAFAIDDIGTSPFPPRCNPTLPPNGQATSTGPYAGLPPCNVQAFMELLRRFINWGTLAIVPLAVIFILYGGVMMMFAAGSEERFRKGRQMIQIALTGVIIAFLAWMIVNSIFLALTQRGVENQLAP